MKLAVLFSGGKDSSLAAFIAKREGHEISCLISIGSLNKESFMFHVPSINKVELQAEAMGIPLIFRKSEGKRELELDDLKFAIMEGMEKYNICGVVSGAVESVYQASRIQNICDELGIECFSPLWQKDQIELLSDLVKEGFEVIVSGVAAYLMDEKFLGRKVNEEFIEEMIKLKDKFNINPAGEGGEYESFVLNCPLFRYGLRVDSFEDFGEKNSWRRELEVSFND